MRSSYFDIIFNHRWWKMTLSKKHIPWYMLLGSTFLASLFWGGLAQMDPFGVKSAANFHSESIFLRFIGGPWYSSEAREKITVLLIDDNYLSATQSYWPLPYLEQDFLLSTLLDYQPKAVFFDLLYRQKHGSDADIDQLVKTMRNTAAGTIFLPYLINDVEGEESCLPGTHSSKTVMEDSVIDVRKSGAIPTYIGWKGCGNHYPAFIFGNKEWKTPAFALYEKVSPEQAPEAAPNDFRRPMMIRWGTGVSKDQKKALEVAGIHCQSLDTDFDRIFYFLQQLGRAVTQIFASTSERGRIEPCTYTDTVHATWFLGASSEEDKELRAHLEKMIFDRIVLVGTKIDGVHDTVLSPVNGKVPGVYLFAMALDNYLEYGPAYYRSMTPGERGVVEVSTLWLITFTMGIFGPAGRLRHVFPTVALYQVCLPFCFSSTFVSIMWGLKFAPMDWIGISLLSFVVKPISVKYSLNYGGWKPLPSITGEASKEGGIWIDIISWVCFLLQRLLSHPFPLQIRRRFSAYIRKT